MQVPSNNPCLHELQEGFRTSRNPSYLPFRDAGLKGPGTRLRRSTVRRDFTRILFTKRKGMLSEACPFFLPFSRPTGLASSRASTSSRKQSARLVKAERSGYLQLFFAALRAGLVLKLHIVLQHSSEFTAAFFTFTSVIHLDHPPNYLSPDSFTVY